VPLEPVEGRLVFDASAFEAPLAPGETREVDVHYMPSRDRVAMGLDVATRFGIAPDADEGVDRRRFGVALRVIGDGPEPATACAAFALDTARPTRTVRPADTAAAAPAAGPRADARPRGRRTLMLFGGLALALAGSAGLLVNAAASGDGEHTAPAPSVAPDERRVTGGSAHAVVPDPRPTPGAPGHAAAPR